MKLERLRIATTCAVVMAAALLAGGCSGDGSPSTGTSRPAPQKEAASASSTSDNSTGGSGGSATDQATPTSGGDTGTGGGSSAATNGKAWPAVTAVFTDDKGATTNVPASTVRYCINEGTGINLNGAQDIPFEKMISIEVKRADKLFAPNGTATVHIVLVTGGLLDGTVGGNCDFFGTNDLGKFSLYPQQLKRIDFPR